LPARKTPSDARSMTMSEQYETYNNPFNYLIDSFWASLPEKTADELAAFKKDVLLTIRNGVDKLIDDEIECTTRHVENARRMRNEYKKDEATDAPPNPA
jgi:hypothetical protein